MTRSRTRILHNFGREDEIDKDAVRRLVAALSRLLYDTAARADEILGLDIGDLDLQDKTATVTGKGGITRQVNWYTQTARLLPRIIGGRTREPLFLTHRVPGHSR